MPVEQHTIVYLKRSALGLPARQVAREVGVDPAHYRRIEAGIQPVPLFSVLALVRVLGVGCTELLRIYYPEVLDIVRHYIKTKEVP